MNADSTSSDPSEPLVEPYQSRCSFYTFLYYLLICIQRLLHLTTTLSPHASYVDLDDPNILCY